MKLRIDFKSSKAVHLQVVDQIRTAAALGVWRQGEALPSIGSFAQELRVHRSSVAKAYSELESLRVIETLPGKGYFLKENHSPLRKDVRRRPLMAEIADAVIPLQAVQKKVHSLTTVLLAALYLGVVGGIGMLIVRVGVVRGELVAVLSTVLAAAVVLPLRSGVQRFVDRVVLARRHALARALQVIKADAQSQPDLDSFMQRLVERTEAVLHGRLELIRDYAEMRTLLKALPSLRSACTPISVGADLLMPVYSDGELRSVLRLGREPSGQEYDAEDSAFLTAVGEQVAIVDNQFRSRKERQEGEYALDIQRDLLPREIPQVPGFTIAGAWQPATTVGGDYYDVFKLSETELALVVADVSGKGTPAALLMASLQATVRAYATAESSPKDLCGQVNRAISRNVAPGKFITFFYAVLDSARGRLTYSNAGHNPPLLARQDGSCLKLQAGGAVLGVFANGAYEEARIPVLPGDRLVLFTDGITEAADSNGEEFGEERLIGILRTHPETPAPDLRDAIMQSVTEFCREDFADDATLLTLTVV